MVNFGSGPGSVLGVGPMRVLEVWSGRGRIVPGSGSVLFWFGLACCILVWSVLFCSGLIWSVLSGFMF
jgi:hypothetical protein